MAPFYWSSNMHKNVFLDLMEDKQGSKGRNYVYHICGDEVKSSDYVLVECITHGEQKKSHVSNLRAGKTPCKECGKLARRKGRADTFETFKTKVIAAFGDASYKLDFSESVYINNNTPVIIKCNKHNFKTQSKPSQLFKGKEFCDHCYEENYNRKRFYTWGEVFIKLTKEHGVKYLYMSETYTGVNKPMQMYCTKHSAEFWSRPSKVWKGQSGCTQCKSEKLSVWQTVGFDDYIAICKKAHKGRNYTYYEDYFDEVGEAKIKFKCNTHGGVFTQSKKDHKRGGTACKQCEKDKINSESRGTRITNMAKTFKENFGDRFIYYWNTYTNADTAMKMYCKEHDLEFQQIPYAHGVGSVGCKHCQDTGTSKLEKDIHDYIVSLGFNPVWGSRSLLGNGLEIDIFIEELNIGIEVNGNYWHSDLRDINFRRYHYDKYNTAKEKGIDLIFIWEYQWNSNCDVTKQFIKDRLGVVDKSAICPSSVYVSEIIDKQLVSTFLKNNHLKGVPKDFDTSIGAFDKESNTLLSVMTFEHLPNDVYKLNRFASKVESENIETRCFNHFCDNHTFKSIKGLCDIQYFKDSFYSNLGFKYLSKLKPRYVVYHRNINTGVSFNLWDKYLIKDRLQEIGQEYTNNMSNMRLFELQDSLTCYRLWNAGKTEWEYLK